MPGMKREGFVRLLVEAAIIVASILLALALDAWWDGVQQDRRRADLIQALVVDFKATSDRLAEARTRTDSAVARTAAFLDAAHSTDPVSVDSLRSLAFGPFQVRQFEPALSSYRAAVSTGEIRLVQNRELTEAFAEFEESLRYLELRHAIYLEGYYLGPPADLRRELGSLRTLYSEDANEYAGLSEAEYRRVARSPAVSGLMEGLLVLTTNIRNGLLAADEGAARVLAELEAAASR